MSPGGIISSSAYIIIQTAARPIITCLSYKKKSSQFPATLSTFELSPFLNFPIFQDQPQFSQKFLFRTLIEQWSTNGIQQTTNDLSMSSKHTQIFSLWLWKSRMSEGCEIKITGEKQECFVPIIWRECPQTETCSGVGIDREDNLSCSLPLSLYCIAPPCWVFTLCLPLNSPQPIYVAFLH